jgi:hypothetical protein
MMLLRAPDNAGYMIAAYAITAVVLLAYSASLVRKARREKGEGSRGTSP